MGARLGEEINSDLNLPHHQNMTSQEISEEIATHFSLISQEYKPLNMLDLSSEIQNKINSINNSDIPQLTEFQVYKKLKEVKKPNSSVPGDIPKRLVQEFLTELAFPVMNIINLSLKY